MILGTHSGPPERGKVTNSGPPEAKSSSQEQDKVTKYPLASGKYSGPPERDKVTNSGPPEINSGPPERDKVGSPGAYPGSLKWDKTMRRGA